MSLVNVMYVSCISFACKISVMASCYSVVSASHRALSLFGKSSYSLALSVGQ